MVVGMSSKAPHSFSLPPGNFVDPNEFPPSFSHERQFPHQQYQATPLLRVEPWTSATRSTMSLGINTNMPVPPEYPTVPTIPAQNSFSAVQTPFVPSVNPSDNVFGNLFVPQTENENSRTYLREKGLGWKLRLKFPGDDDAFDIPNEHIDCRSAIEEGVSGAAGGISKSSPSSSHVDTTPRPFTKRSTSQSSLYVSSMLELI